MEELIDVICKKGLENQGTSIFYETKSLKEVLCNPEGLGVRNNIR